MATWEDIKTWKPGTRFTEDGGSCILLGFNADGVSYAYEYAKNSWESECIFKESNALKTWKLIEEKPTQKENDLSGAKVGDRLWSYMLGWGEVVKLYDKSHFPIAVRFRHTTERYTSEGRYQVCEPPVIFWDEIFFDYPAPPKDRQKVKVECEGEEYFVTREKFSELIK